MVFIAFNYKDDVISIVNAKSRELAMAFWQGRNIIPQVVKSLDNAEDYIPLDKHPTGVYELFNGDTK